MDIWHPARVYPPPSFKHFLGGDQKTEIPFLTCAPKPSVPKLICSRLQKNGHWPTLHSAASASRGVQLCSGSLGKTLCNCAISCQGSLAVPWSFQAKFLQVHDQFWTIKQCHIKRNENTVSSSSQLEKIKYLWVCFMCCTYLTLGRSCRSQGFEIQREGNISTWLLSLLLLHMWEFPLSSLLCPSQNSFSFWLRNIDVSAIYCSPGSFPLLCLPTQQFFPRCKETWLEEFL